MTPPPQELAEDTIAHVLPGPMFERLELDGFVFAATPQEAGVQRIRLGEAEAAVEAAVETARREALRLGSELLEWWVGWSATPRDLAARLLDRGFTPGETPVLTGMTCDHAPPAAGVEARRIETLEAQLRALEVDWDVWELTAEQRARRVATERRRFDPTGSVHHFAVYVDGEPVGFGRAVDMDGGVALLGGAVLPAFRGRGVYRALVRARWEHAAARGTPLLVVQAGPMSAPVLDGLGFRRHGDLHLFADPVVGSRHGDD